MVLHALDSNYKDCLREAIGLAVIASKQQSKPKNRLMILVPSNVARTATLCATDELVQLVSALSAIEIVQVELIDDFVELIQDDSLTNCSILACCMSFLPARSKALSSQHLHVILSLLSQACEQIIVIEPNETVTESSDAKSIIEWVTQL
jgi:hypothetical protein